MLRREFLATIWFPFFCCCKKLLFFLVKSISGSPEKPREAVRTGWNRKDQKQTKFVSAKKSISFTDVYSLYRQGLALIWPENRAPDRIPVAMILFYVNFHFFFEANCWSWKYVFFLFTKNVWGMIFMKSEPGTCPCRFSWKIRVRLEISISSL